MLSIWLLGMLKEQSITLYIPRFDSMFLTLDIRFKEPRYLIPYKLKSKELGLILETTVEHSAQIPNSHKFQFFLSFSSNILSLLSLLRPFYLFQERMRSIGFLKLKGTPKIIQFSLLVLQMKTLRFKRDLTCSRSYSLLGAELDQNPELMTLRINCVQLRGKSCFHQEETGCF